MVNGGITAEPGDFRLPVHRTDDAGCDLPGVVHVDVSEARFSFRQRLAPVSPLNQMLSCKMVSYHFYIEEDQMPNADEWDGLSSGLSSQPAEARSAL